MMNMRIVMNNVKTYRVKFVPVEDYRIHVSWFETHCKYIAKMISEHPPVIACSEIDPKTNLDIKRNEMVKNDCSPKS
jgi:hypothetical protein